MSIYDPPEGYEYDTLIITVDGGYERDRTVEARECSRCGAVVITLEAHNQRCPMDEPLPTCARCHRVSVDPSASDTLCPPCRAEATRA